MLAINELINFLKKKGFRDTMQVLTQFKNYKTNKHTFYNQLNRFSYYNSFFRVQEDLIDKGIIENNEDNGTKYIRLTEKGLEVYNKLIGINQLIQ